MATAAFSPAYNTARLAVSAGAGTALQVMNDPKVGNNNITYKIINTNSTGVWVVFGPTAASVAAPAFPAAGTISPSPGILIGGNEFALIALPPNYYFNCIGSGSGDLYITPGGGL